MDNPVHFKLHAKNWTKMTPKSLMHFAIGLDKSISSFIIGLE